MNLVRFGTDDVDNVLATLSAEELDELAFGAIELDEHGTILSYNAMEAEITGRRKEEMLGKNFFREVAPCSDTQEFRGAFEHGVETGKLNSLFEYTFDYKMEPTKVQVHMKRSERTGTFWIFVKRLSQIV